MAYDFYPVGCRVQAGPALREGIVAGYLDPDLPGRLPRFYVSFPDGDGNGFAENELAALPGEEVWTLDDEKVG